MGRRGQHRPLTVPGDPGDAHGFPALVEEFCTDLLARGYSPATVTNRRQGLAQLATWLADRGVSRPVEVNRPMLVRYQRHLFHYRKADGDPLSFRSQNQRLLTVRAFYKWAVRNNLILSNPASELELPKVERRLPRPSLSITEAELVLAGPDLSSLAGLRDRAMLEVFYSTGIRRAELAHLALFDLDADRLTLMVRQGKGRKDRMVPIGARALAWVERYLIEARPQLAVEPDDGTLFLTVDGHGFSVDRLTQLARSYVVASGVAKQGACHLFRHTMATLMLEGGADIRFIQQMLGHADISTTQIYTHVSIRQLQAIHAATHPGALNTRHRTVVDHDEHQATASDIGGHHDDGNGTTRSGDASKLLSVLAEEDQEENRPGPGSRPQDCARS
jgi:integrase/recombinase XerD